MPAMQRLSQHCFLEKALDRLGAVVRGHSLSTQDRPRSRPGGLGRCAVVGTHAIIPGSATGSLGDPGHVSLPCTPAPAAFPELLQEKRACPVLAPGLRVQLSLLLMTLQVKTTSTPELPGAEGPLVEGVRNCKGNGLFEGRY